MILSVVRSPKLNATSAFALIALLSGGAAVEAQVGTGRVGVKPLPGAEMKVKQAPVAVGKVKSAQPAKIEEVRVAALLAVAQISQGQLTPQQAWERDLLNASDILQLLSRPQRLTQSGSNEDLKRDLAGLLVRYAPETVGAPKQLSARVRLELCHYYSEQGDERVVPLCEALIAEKLDGKQVKMPTGAAAEPDNVSLWLGAVIYLAQYYEKVGQWQQAAETWERALTFWQDASWWQAGVRVDAARAYKRTGTPENQVKAAQLYALVPTFGNQRDTLMARYDQAYALIKDDHHKEARLLLLMPVEGANTAEIQVGLLSLLSASYLKTGEVDLAQETAQKALDTYRTVSKPTRNMGIEPQLERARKVLNWSWRYKAGNANPAENTKTVAPADVELPPTKG